MTNKIYPVLITLLVLFISVAPTIAADDTIEVTATGVGTTVEAAEKNALMNAVQQAVGLYVDGETLIKNDQVIYEKILSASSGYITSYKTTIPTRKRLADGLYETTIRAVVQKSKVVEELKKAHVQIISVEVPGKDTWAEAITRIKRAEDGRRLLHKLLNEAQLNLLKAEFVDNVGQHGVASAKPVVTAAPKEGRIICGWNIEISYDRELFYKTTAPRLEKLLTAISDQHGKTDLQVLTPSTVRGKSKNYSAAIGLINLPIRFWSPLPVHDALGLKSLTDAEMATNGSSKIYVLLNSERSANGEREIYKWYRLEKKDYAKVMEYATTVYTPETLHLSLIANDNSVIAQGSVNLDYSLLRSPGALLRSKSSTLENMTNYRLVRTRSLVVLDDYSSQFDTPELRKELGERSRVTIALIAPEFRSGSPFYFQGEVPWRRYGLFDSIVVPWEIEIQDDDLKNLKEVKMTFKRGKHGSFPSIKDNEQ